MNYTIDQGVTQSLLQAFMSCRKRATHALEQWKPVALRDSLYWGSMIHWMCAEHYQDRGASAAGYLVSEGRKVTELDQKEQNTLFLANTLMDSYREYWAEADKAMEWIAVETEFDVELFGVRVRGKRDGLFRNKQGVLWLLETKTLSQLNEEQTMDRLMFDFQSLFYILATESWEINFLNKF